MFSMSTNLFNPYTNPRITRISITIQLPTGKFQVRRSSGTTADDDSVSGRVGTGGVREKGDVPVVDRGEGGVLDCCYEGAGESEDYGLVDYAAGSLGCG
jgi:hypothetical protein